METMPVISTFEYRKRLYTLFSGDCFQGSVVNQLKLREQFAQPIFWIFFSEKKLGNKMLRMRCIRPASSN